MGFSHWLTSKIPPLGSMLNFHADVKIMTAHHQCKNSFSVWWCCVPQYRICVVSALSEKRDGEEVEARAAPPPPPRDAAAAARCAACAASAT